MKAVEADIATSSDYFVLAAQATMACLLLARSHASPCAACRVFSMVFDPSSAQWLLVSLR